MTRRRDVAAAEDEALARARRRLRPGRDPGRQDLEAPPREGDEGQPRGEPGDDRATRSPSCASAGKRVIYDAEHFFDGYRDDRGYALECLRAAAEAGAENVTLCDTNGSSLPHQVAEATRDVVGATSTSVDVGIHTHNDLECGVANSLAAVEEGASLVQGTINGIGERTGNANLTSILPALQLKLGYECVTDEQLARLTEIAHFVDELLNVHARTPSSPSSGATPSPTRAACTSPASRPTPAPSSTWTLSWSGTSARWSSPSSRARAPSTSRAERAGLELDDEQAARALRTLKEREHRGYQYEAARRLLRAAAAARDRPLRAPLQARELPRDHREARGRQGPDRGDDQGLGRGRALRAAPPRATARSTRSTRRCATRSPTATRTWPTSS